MTEAEPEFTIHVPEWSAAWERLASIEPLETRTLLAAAMEHIESGWPAVRDLQRWVDRNRDRAGADDDYGCLLTYAETEVREAFRTMTLALARVVADWPGDERASIDDADGWLSAFSRYVNVLRLATASAKVPSEFRVVMRGVVPLGLGGPWFRQASDLLRSVGDRSRTAFSAQDARGAVDTLTHAVREPERERIKGLLVADLRARYATAGQDPPDWLNLLQTCFAAPPAASAENDLDPRRTTNCTREGGINGADA